MRILHTMIRVYDLDRSIAFYQDFLGMKLLRKKDYPHGKFTLAFMGYQEEAEGAALELTYNWDTKHYDIGTGYGHIAVSVDDIYSICKKIEEMGGSIPRPPGPMKGSSSLIAFIEDPDGYKIELIEKKSI